jgi:hypothetical protein
MPSTPSTSTQVVPPPLFKPVTEFFLRLKKNYQRVKMKKLRRFRSLSGKLVRVFARHTFVYDD